MSELNRILERKFKSVSNKKLVSVLNRRYKNGLNDDDYVGELFREQKTKF